MKYFSMSGTMNTEMMDKFLDFTNNNKEDEWAIILNTSGGSFFATETILRIINSRPDNVQIWVQGAYSSGFLLIREVKCKIVLSKTCRGMWHYGRWDIQYSDKNKPYYWEDECIIRNLPSHKKQTESVARKVMTPKEYKNFKADKDIYFDFKRMKQIFPDAEIMK